MNSIQAFQQNKRSILISRKETRIRNIDSYILTDPWLVNINQIVPKAKLMCSQRN